MAPSFLPWLVAGRVYDSTVLFSWGPAASDAGRGCPCGSAGRRQAFFVIVLPCRGLVDALFSPARWFPCHSHPCLIRRARHSCKAVPAPSFPAESPPLVAPLPADRRG